MRWWSQGSRTYSRLDIERALDEVVEREDGRTFQRLARMLLREQIADIVPHAEHYDLGRDATVRVNGTLGNICISLSASYPKISKDIRRILVVRR